MRAFWEDAAVDHGTTTEGSLRYRLSRALETWTLRRADAVTTICEGLRERHRRPRHSGGASHGDPECGGHRGVSAHRRSRTGSCRRGSGSTDAFTLGFLGSFYGYEGLDTLLDALPQILQFEPRDAAAAGRRRLRGSSDSRRRRRGSGIADKVIFAGRVPHGEVARYYSLVDLLVYPRKSMRLTETVTPLKPLEAMAQGRLLIASDVGGHRELIEDGVTGLLFRPDDPAALADAVRRVLADRDRWDEIKAAGRRFVEQERNWRASVGRYRAVYDAAPSRGRPAMTCPAQTVAGRARCRRRRAAWPTRRGSSQRLLQAEGMHGRAGADQCSLPPGVDRQPAGRAGRRSGSCRTCCVPPAARPGRRGARHGELRLGVAPVRRAGDPHRALARHAGRGQLPRRAGARSSWRSRARASVRGMRQARGARVPSRFLQEVVRAARHAGADHSATSWTSTTFRPAEPRVATVAIGAASRRHAQSRAAYGNDVASAGIRARCGSNSRRTPVDRRLRAGARCTRGLAAELGLADAVRFTGRLETRRAWSALYQSADLVLNPVARRQHAELGPRGAGLRRAGGEHERGRRAVPRRARPHGVAGAARDRPKRWPTAALHVLGDAALRRELVGQRPGPGAQLRLAGRQGPVARRSTPGSRTSGRRPVARRAR